MVIQNKYITPIQMLSEKLNNNEFYIKRDDLFPLSFGGNKARKALLFFKDIKKVSADCVVTYGSSSSNHCRVVANIAASLELPCYIISPIESSYPTYNSKFLELFRAKVDYCKISEVKITIEQKMKSLKEKGYKPYFIQGGGHGNLGTQAYHEVYNEILEYERINNIYYDYIFLTSGTGTTQAGLISGKIINGDSRKIIGISNARRNPYGRKVVLESVNNYLSTLTNLIVLNKDIDFVDDFILDGYGSYNYEILKTIRSVFKSDGIPLDPIYTGKSYWGMLEYIRNNKIHDKKILFIHTGGTPLFFDKLGELIDE